MNPIHRRPLSLDGLRAFEAVARRLSFSAAADELHLTQSAISRQIKALETELGAALFNRGTRKVELTAAGVLLRQAWITRNGDAADHVLAAGDAMALCRADDRRLDPEVCASPTGDLP